MALPKGVKSPVDYTKLYMSQVLDGETISEKALSKKQQRFFGIVRAIQKESKNQLHLRLRKQLQI